MSATGLLIQSIEIYQSNIQLKEPFIISLGLLTHAENVIVIIKTNKGITGTGECSPFKTINGESMETGFVVGQYLAKGLIGQNPLDIEVCTKLMDSIIYANNSIKSAFDMALYDIAAQQSNLPLYAFLGGSNNKILVTDYTVSFDSPVKMAADAVKIKANGFQIVKIKLGGSKEEDVERIRKIREAIGMEMPLRIDANQGWTAGTASDILQALAPYNIQHCEEPIPRWDFMQLPAIRKQSPIKIMADESCCDEHDAQRLVDLQACDSLNVKLGKSAGIFRAKKILQIAEQQNMMVQIGGFLESRLAFTAAAHLALTSDAVVHCDFDTPLMFMEDHVIGGINYSATGEVTLPETPGIGASFDENYLQQLKSIMV